MLLIRAVQGHSIQGIILDEELLTEVTNDTIPVICIHGTYKSFLPLIKEKGLLKMTRNHIHFFENIPDANTSVVSGMRQNCNICIYIDVQKCMNDGIRFFRANNGVLLSRGLNETGCIPCKYFQKIENRDGSLREVVS